MDTIIGLGEAGCNIATAFQKYDQYKVYKIDVGLEGIKETGYGDFPQDGIYSMPKQTSPEAYEKNCPDMKYFFKGMSGEILFVIGGSGSISGASLKILQQLQHCDINVLYIQPDFELLPEAKRVHERSTYYILQEYARSAKFKRMFLISNNMIENHLENVPLVGYYDKINEMIVSTFHMINVYNHLKPVTDTFYHPYETARISTVGIFNIEDGANKEFFSLDKVREMRYYYAINKNDLGTDGSLFKKIKQQIRDAAVNGVKTSYGIFSTDYEQNYGYAVGFSSSIQRRENEKKMFS